MDQLLSPFINLLSFFTWLVPGHNLAAGIVLLTLMVRLILIVPSKRAAQAQRRQAQLQPLMEELKAEYADDKQGLAAAQMELFKKNGINPFGACVPILIQFPILIILYRAIIHGLTPTDPTLYAWIPKPPFISGHFLWLDLLHMDPYYLLPALAGILQFIQMRMVMPSAPVPSNATPDSSRAIQNQMMYVMPVIYFIFTKGYPAGVALYLVTTTLFSIAQQFFVNKERIRLEGVEKAVEKVEKLHPQDTKLIEEVKAEVLEPQKSKSKGGISVTVRKKSKN